MSSASMRNLSVRSCTDCSASWMSGAARHESREKIPHMLRHLEAEQYRRAGCLSDRDRPVAVDVAPVASEVILGASAVAEAVRRIGLDEAQGSGRCRIDVGWALESPRSTRDHRVCAALEVDLRSASAFDSFPTPCPAAMRAPSGGNMQPWVIEADPVKVTVSVAAEHTSTMDAGFRGSAVAVGAALFNIRVAAAAREVLGPVSVVEDVGGTPLQATMSSATRRPRPGRTV